MLNRVYENPNLHGCCTDSPAASWNSDLLCFFRVLPLSRPPFFRQLGKSVASVMIWSYKNKNWLSDWVVFSCVLKPLIAAAAPRPTLSFTAEPFISATSLLSLCSFSLMPLSFHKQTFLSAALHPSWLPQHPLLLSQGGKRMFRNHEKWLQNIMLLNSW